MGSLNEVSGRITSDALWKDSKVRYFYWEFDYIFIPQSGRKLIIIGYNITISPWLLLREGIISQLKLGPTVI